MFFVTIGFRFFIDLGHDGVQAFRPASHDQVAHQGFQGRAVVVLGDGGALRRQGIGIAGPLADGLFVVRQAVVDAAVDIGLGLGGYEFCLRALLGSSMRCSTSMTLRSSR